MKSPTEQRDTKAHVRQLIDRDPIARELYIRYLGVLGLLAECSVRVDDEQRDSIVRAFEHATDYGLHWRQTLDRLEIEPQHD